MLQKHVIHLASRKPWSTKFPLWRVNNIWPVAYIKSVLARSIINVGIVLGNVCLSISELWSLDDVRIRFCLRKTLFYLNFAELLILPRFYMGSVFLRLITLLWKNFLSVKICICLSYNCILFLCVMSICSMLWVLCKLYLLSHFSFLVWILFLLVLF